MRAWLLTIGALTMLTWAGCHRETPIERSARIYRQSHASRMSALELQTKLDQGVPDIRLLQVNQLDGLGLGLQPEKTELRVGQPLRFHLAYENLGAGEAISATTCQGFSLGSEDQSTLVLTSVELRFACPTDDSNHDHNVELPRGVLRTANLSTDGTTLRFDHPGQYVLVAGWQSFRRRDGTFVRGDGYSVIASNRALITVR